MKESSIGKHRTGVKDVSSPQSSCFRATNTTCWRRKELAEGRKARLDVDP